MASIDTIARGFVLILPEPAENIGFWRAEGIALMRSTGPFQVQALLVEQDFDANRNQVLVTCTGNAPVPVGVSSVSFEGRVGIRFTAAGDQLPVGIYFQVLERIDNVSVPLPI